MSNLALAGEQLAEAEREQMIKTMVACDLLGTTTFCRQVGLKEDPTRIAPPMES